MGRYDDKPINPLYKIEPGEAISPIFNTEDMVNTPERFAILKTTEGGKYVRGGLLYYKLKGVELYTEINNVILVDRISNTLTVKQAANVLNIVDPVDPEERQYIILMYNPEANDSFDYIWASMTGRTEAYNYIKDNILLIGFDPDQSLVLTENVPYKDAKTVTQFIQYLQNGLVEEDDFNIEDYKFE
jgi:hypothetical protein